MARRDDILVSRTLYELGVISLITSVIWLGVGIYSARGKELKIDVDPTILAPINPTIDQEVFKRLSGRLKIEVDLTEQLESSPSASVSASINAGGSR